MGFTNFDDGFAFSWTFCEPGGTRRLLVGPDFNADNCGHFGLAIGPVVAASYLVFESSKNFCGSCPFCDYSG
jgi:hypothetical protein